MKVALFSKEQGKKLFTNISSITHDAIGAPRSMGGKLSLTLCRKLDNGEYHTEYSMVDSFIITTDEDTLLD